VPDALERVVLEINKSVSSLKECRGEMELSIKSLRQQYLDIPDNGHSHSDHLALAQMLLQANQAQYGSPRRGPVGPNSRNQ
jgi:hypothetical protein